MWTIRKILIPIDGSEPSIEAARVALDLAKRHMAEVVVLFVMDIPHLFLAEKLIETFRQDIAEPAVGRVLEFARSKDVRATPMIVEGHPAEMIVKVACEQKVDLIAMGTRGASKMRKFLTGLGSVAQAVLVNAPCPVLVIKGEVRECDFIE